MAVTKLLAGAWRGFRMAYFPNGSWQLEAGVLRAQAKAKPIDLVTREVYRNFVLTLEWCLPRGGNSGVLYRVSENWPAPWQSGPEMQLLDDQEHPDSQRPETSCGALYGLLEPEQGNFPADTLFRSARLLVHDSYVEHWLNDSKVLDYKLSDPALQSRIAQSKFKDCPGFGRQREGHIVLQHHGTEAWFQNIRIQVLPH